MVPFSIATAGDDKYASVLKGLIASLRSFPAGADVPIVVLDLGIGAALRDWLSAQGAACVTPDWDFQFTKIMPEFYKAIISRPCLPKYVPDGEVIVWLDADTWVQDWGAIELMLARAEKERFAIASECDRSCFPIFDGLPFLQYQIDLYKLFFDQDTTKRPTAAAYSARHHQPSQPQLCGKGPDIFII